MGDEQEEEINNEYDDDVDVGDGGEVGIERRGVNLPVKRG